MNDTSQENTSKYQEGQSAKFTRVRFPGHAKSYAFALGHRKLKYGQKVVAMSDRGMAVGYINSFEYEATIKKDMLPVKTINKIASTEDIEKEQETYKKQKETETLCQNLIDKHKLDMNMTHVEFTQFGKKVVFYFVAPSRVDFRGLVKDLVGELKLRIELRQISVRDRAASMGAIGPCGRELCCSSFLSKYGNVSIKMAKNQNLTLNYSRLNGVCGQLKCCLSYEDDVYSGKRKNLPNEGDFIQTKSGDKGRVQKLNLLNEQFDMMTDKGQIKRFTADQFKKKMNETYKFPRRFDNISDETANVIGLVEVTEEKEKFDKKDMHRLTKKAKTFARNRVIDLLGEDSVTANTPETEPEIEVEEEKNYVFKDLSTPVEEADVKENKEERRPSRNNNNRRKPQNRNRNNNSNSKNTDTAQDKDGENKPVQKRNNNNRNRYKKNNRNKKPSTNNEGNANKSEKPAKVNAKKQD